MPNRLNLSEAPTGRRIFVLAFAILSFEMASIRWLNASVQILSYFSNLILISCFLGLGLGCLLEKRPARLLRFFGPAFLLLVFGTSFLSRHGISLTVEDDVVFAQGARYLPEGIALTLPLSAFAAFFLNTLFFVLLGQELARLLRASRTPGRGYSFDLAGSLAGTVSYALLSGLGAPPWVWCAGALVVLLLLLGKDGIAWNLIASAAAVLLLASADGPDTRWSPYYKVEREAYTHPEFRGLVFKIRVNGQRIQDALNFGPDLEKTRLGPWREYYDLPFRTFRPRRVLILGAGSGNEAFIAAENGAAEIDAVEIDPVLADLGRRTHPKRPYSLPSVRVVVDDARAFLSRAEGPYDLVVMSALDSHKHVSGLNLRLESFVYTVESFRRIKDLLAPDGAFCLNLSAQRPWMAGRTWRSLAQAFGHEPQLLMTRGSPFASIAYISTPDGARVPGETLDSLGILEFAPNEAMRAEQPATDDWPFLYLESRRIPTLQLAAILALFVLSAGAAYGCGYRSGPGDLHFFLLGAAFMLLETRGLTSAALLFGTTWLVNAIVIGGILALLWAGNEAVLRGRAPRRNVAFGLLVASLAVSYFLPLQTLLVLDRPLRLVAGALWIGLPVLWASFLFSAAFEKTPRPASALGANLLGVVFGACLEQLSNVVGLRALFLVALGLYALAVATAPKPPGAVTALGEPADG